jgi:thiamine-phosphate pyrophosphorylase
VCAIFEAGADWLQVRERQLDGAALLDFARELSDAARAGAAASGREARILVNRRIDIALAIGADGVHLGFDAVSVADARSALGDNALVGVSTHSATEVRDAAAGGADYAQLAPIFTPLSKVSTRPSLGTSVLTDASANGVRVFAQGGVCVENVAAILAAGAAGVCVTGALLQADDPAGATRTLRAALDAAAL